MCFVRNKLTQYYLCNSILNFAASTCACYNRQVVGGVGYSSPLCSYGRVETSQLVTVDLSLLDRNKKMVSLLAFIDLSQHTSFLFEFSNRDTEFMLIPQFLAKLRIYIASPPIPESVLIQKYLENRLSIRDIASEFACSKTRVRDLLLKLNIPLRPRSQLPQHRSTTYGKRKVKGKIVEHQAELRAVATIKQMYREGMNTMAIARCLNAMKLPTKQRERESGRQASMSKANGRCWHQNTVAKILKREGVYVVGRPSCG